MKIIDQLELLAIFCAVLTCGDLFCHREGDMSWVTHGINTEEYLEIFRGD
jgi:hypothetical protein